jgi:glc operon protein GlcG
MNIAIVDDGGHLAAFSRMDGAKLSSARISIAKAHASAIRRLPSGAPNNDPATVLMALSLSVTSRAHQTPLRGGLPILVEGQCIGAIGVSNGSEEQDLDVARAGIAALVIR